MTLGLAIVGSEKLLIWTSSSISLSNWQSQHLLLVGKPLKGNALILGYLVFPSLAYCGNEFSF